jgi:TPR repeat protein
MKTKIIALTAIVAIMAMVAILPALSQNTTTATNKPLTELSIGDSLTITEGQLFIIVPTISPTDADVDLRWVSDNDSIATADCNEIQAIHEGTATVTVTDALTGISTQCIVTVVKQTAEELAEQEAQKQFNARIDAILKITARADSIDIYRQRAYNDDAEAFAKLATCYHYGIGVKRSLSSMLSMYKQSARCIGDNSKGDFILDRFADDDVLKLTYQAADAADRHYTDEVKSLLEKLRPLDPITSEVVELISSRTEKEDNNEALLDYARKGNELAILSLFVYGRADYSAYDEPELAQFANVVPLLYNVLGLRCAKNEPTKAVKYLQQADTNLVLLPKAATLMAYFCKHELGGMKYDELTYQRYLKLAQIQAGDEEQIVNR